MTRDEWIDWGSKLPFTIMDYPFDNPDMVVLRHQSTKKWFALFLYVQGKPCVNVKCDPLENASLCEVYEGITPGYHMNKRHWITIALTSDIAEEEIKYRIRDSHMRTHKVRKRSEQKD